MSEETEKLFGDKKIPPKQMFKRLAHYVLTEWKAFALALFLILVNVAIDVILPLFLREFTNKVADINTALSFIIGLSIGYFSLSIVTQALIYFESMILQKTGQRIVYKLRMEVFEHIENMSQNQFNIMPVGSLVTRVANYTTSMSDLFTNVLIHIIRNIATVVAVYVIMVIISWRLSLILLGFMVVIFIISFFFSKIVHKIFHKERADTSALNAFLNESLSGMKIIQLFDQEVRKEKQFNSGKVTLLP